MLGTFISSQLLNINMSYIQEPAVHAQRIHRMNKLGLGIVEEVGDFKRE